MTKEEFEALRKDQKESGKSIKTFLARRVICFTSYYYWKKKFELANPMVSFFPSSFTTTRISNKRKF